MKKIIFFLFIFFCFNTALFSGALTDWLSGDSCPSTYTNDNLTYILHLGEKTGTALPSNDYPRPAYKINGSDNTFSCTFSFLDSTDHRRFNYYSMTAVCKDKYAYFDKRYNSPCVCPAGQNDDGTCKNPCLTGQEYDSSTKSCINSCDPLNGSMKDGYGGCIDCTMLDDLQLRANCLCSGQGFFDGAEPPTTVIKESHNGSMYSFYEPYCNGSYVKVPVYLKDEDLDFSPDPCLTAISWGASTPVGFIFKGSVHSTDECSQYVNGTDYLDSRTKKVYPDCPSSNELYCYLKPSADNNDTGIAAPDSNQTDENGNLKSDVTPPPLDINSTPSGYNMNTVEKTNNLLGQSLSDFKAFANKYNKDNEWWKKDNTRKFNTRTQNDNANNARLIASNTANSNKIKSSIEKLNGTIGEKLDTLIDKNTSVDLSPATTKLDQLHKDLNTTNIKLQVINDALKDLNDTFDFNSSGLSLSDMLPSESWFSSHTLDLSGVNNYDGDCYLESFTWTDGSGVHTFPPQNVIDMIPFDVISNIIFAFLYLIGLRQFLRS